MTLNRLNSLKDNHGEVYSIQHYVIKFVSDKLVILPVPSTNKTDHHQLTEMLLKVALDTMTITQIFKDNN